MLSVANLKKSLVRVDTKKHEKRHAFKRSAVVMVVRDTPQGAELLMIKRAERDGDPWSGHMGFPGGRQEEDDGDIFATAVREVEEELGFDVTAVAGDTYRLSDLQATGHGRLLPLVVTPFVMFAHSEMVITPNDEVADYVWIPLEFFTYAGNRSHFEWLFEGKTYRLPCYYYRQYKVWGLSLKMLDEWLEVL